MVGGELATKRHGTLNSAPSAPTPRQPLPPSLEKCLPRVHKVTSPPPEQPPPSMSGAMNALRRGEAGALPGRAVGFRAVLNGKRGRSALRETGALTEEVNEGIPVPKGSVWVLFFVVIVVMVVVMITFVRHRCPCPPASSPRRDHSHLQDDQSTVCPG